MIRILVAIGSQALASVATVVLSVAVARVTTPTDFGHFSIVVATWIILVGSIRAITGEMLVYNHSHRQGEEHVQQRQGAQSAAFYLAILAGVILAFASLLLPELTVSLCLLAIGLPAFVAQDNNRFIFSAHNQQQRALIVDTLFIAALISGAFTPFAPESLEALLGVWISSAWISAALGTALIGYSASISKAINWVKSQRLDSQMYFSDFFVANAVANSAVFIVAIASGPEASGAIRGAQILLVPILLIMRGASVALGPQMARHARSGPQQLVVAMTALLTVAQLLAIVLSWLVITVAPSEYIQAILGDSTSATLEIFPYAAFATLALGSATVAMLALKASGNVRWSVRFKVWTAPLTLALVIVGSQGWSAAGSQVGLALGELFRTILEWVILLTWYKRIAARESQNTKPVASKKTLEAK